MLWVHLFENHGKLYLAFRRHESPKYLVPLLEGSDILLPGLRIHVSRKAGREPRREGSDVSSSPIFRHWVFASMLGAP